LTVKKEEEPFQTIDLDADVIQDAHPIDLDLSPPSEVIDI
jgi:hypothetical protein